jgi:hypothetical protein
LARSSANAGRVVSTDAAHSRISYPCIER